MAGVFADTGAQYFLGLAASDTTKETEWEVHLYTDDINPTDSSDADSFTEATGGGYAAATLSADVSFIDSVAITSSSAANPTNIEATGHGLSNGDYITIKNHAGSSTNINGTHQITLVDVDNFTIPVDLSGGTGGTGGTLSRGIEVSSDTGIMQAAANPIPFFFTGSLTGSPPIRGYWVETGDGTFIGAEKFGDTFTPTTSGDILNVTLLLKMSKGTAT